MAWFKKILVVIGNDENLPMVLTRALRLANRSGGQVTVLMSYPNQHPGEDAGQRNEFVTSKEQLVMSRIHNLDSPSLLGKVIVTTGEPTAEVVDKLLETDTYDVIMKAPEPHHLFKELFNNSLDRYFIDKTNIPVWLVKPVAWNADSDILSCLEVNKEGEQHEALNRKIMAISDQLSHLFEADWHLIDCYYGEIGTMRIEYDSKKGFKREASLKEQHLAKIRPYIQQYSLPEDALHFLEGIPDDAIPETAMDLNAELTVIGDTGSSLVERLFGDTALRLSEKMPCDILIVKP